MLAIVTPVYNPSSQLRQEDCEFMAGLDYIGRPRLSCSLKGGEGRDATSGDGWSQDGKISGVCGEHGFGWERTTLVKKRGRGWAGSGITDR